MKRVLSIQDMSCFGKCSQTIAMPILSVMDVEPVPLITSLLSSHTDIEGFTFHSLTDWVQPALDQWKKIGLKFDAIYTGYLGSKKDVDMVAQTIEYFKDENTRVIIDPAMADNGKLYPGFDMDYVRYNINLLKHADVILPNLTEACMLLDKDIPEKWTEEEYQKTLKGLVDTGCKVAVLTGASLSEDTTGVYGYVKDQDRFFSYQTKLEPASYHGTGDAFSATFVGALVNGIGLEDALKIASEYIKETIAKTFDEVGSNWYSINIEDTLPDLAEKLHGIK